MLERLPFDTDGGFGTRARIGLIVLESDQTIEAEARMIDIEGVDFYHSRIPVEFEVTPDTLRAMKAQLPAAARQLPNEFAFDAIGYGCTSAATIIGAQGITDGIQTAHPGMVCSNPISAAVAAFAALGAKRIAVVTPYTEQVTAPIVDHFADAGLTVTALGSFLESSDLVVARITEQSIAAGAKAIAAKADCDAVFVSCTSLRGLRIIDVIERSVGVPVVSSNQALFWHLLRLAGVDDDLDGLGTLFKTAL